jgi:hypothetical protein
VPVDVQTFRLNFGAGPVFAPVLTQFAEDDDGFSHLSRFIIFVVGIIIVIILAGTEGLKECSVR